VKTWQTLTAAAASLVTVLVLVGNVGAQGKPQKVGTVLDIDGPKLMTNRHQEGRWFQAYPTMATNLGERMKSDAKTTATLEFAIGGRAVISPGTEIEIVGQRDIDVVGNKVIVKSGKMWAKIDKQNSQLQIQTSGGVMGIEGTEFVVEVSGEDTTLSMLEGSIAVTDADGQTERFKGGEIADFGRKKRLQRRALAKEIKEALDAGDPGAARELLLKNAGFSPGSRGAVRFALSRKRGAGPRVFRNVAAANFGPVGKLARKRAIAGPGAGPGPRRRGPLRQNGAIAQPESVSDLKAQGALPSFSWKPVSGASQYSVVLTEDPDGQHPLWSAVTQQTTITYPAYGPDLTPGYTYHWSVLPHDSQSAASKDEATGLGVSSTYTAQGHQAKPLAVEGLTVSTGSAPVSASWNVSPAAESYQVSVSTDPNFDELVWADSTAETHYSFPAEARGLNAGDYLMRVDAFDGSGVKTGSSPVVSFTTAGWTSAGATEP
jgi:hypothetical protein